MPTWNDQLLEPARRVVDAVHGLDYSFCLVRHDRDQDGHVVNAEPSYATFAGHERTFARALKHGEELFMLIGQTVGAGVKVADITQSWAVAVDFDNGLHDLCQSGAPLEPTLAIQTTAPDRWHVVYVLDAPVGPPDMLRLARALAARLGGDLAMARVSQQIRLPGFKHGKHGQEVTLHADIGRAEPYTYEQLWMLCDAALYEANLFTAVPQLRDEGGRQAPPDSPETRLEHAKSAVEHLGARGYAGPYDKWMPVIASLASLGPSGHSIAEEFSKRSDRYDAEGFERKWAHFTKTQTGSLRTLFAIAQKAGWQNPGFSQSAPAATDQRELDDRDFGDRLARDMRGEFAAVETLPDVRGKSGAAFLEWKDGAYRVLDDREKRQALHTAGRALSATLGANLTRTVAKKLGSNGGLEDVAQHVAEFLIPLTQGRVVGSYPYLPVANGVLNLHTRQLAPAEYRAVPLMSCSVAFDPRATAARFDQFLNEVFKGKPEMRSYVLRIMGFALLGKPVLEQAMFIFIGTGSNGKSTLLNVFLAMLGKLAVRVPTETLMQKSHVSDSATPALAKLAGKRLVLAAEPEKNHRLAISLIKQMAGETSLPVRSLYSGGTDMPVECVLVMSANNMPYAPDEPAVWRRIHIVPFDNVFTDDGKNRELIEQLLRESSGILNMILEGLGDYEKQRLNPPDRAITATQDRRLAGDPLTMFLSDRCTVGDMQRAGLKKLWAAYQEWAPQHKQFPVMLKGEFSDGLAKKFDRKIISNLPVFVGVALSEQTGE